MAATAPGGKLTPKAFAAWTYALTLVLAVSLYGVQQGVGPVGFTIVFVPAFLVVMALSWTGRWDRLLPAALATLVVGLWPLYRWLADGDARTARAFLILAGMIDGMLLLATVMEFAKRRGWVVESPVRRRLFIGSLLVNAISIVIGWPTGVWHTRVDVAWFAVLLSALFWPARRPSPPSQSVTA